jgi:hypothetical protein
MEETKLDIIIMRCEYIELLEYLQNISIEFADLNIFEGFIYYDTNNEDTYKISKVINNNEIYSFQYKEGHFIPNAEFHKDVHYDFEIDLLNKKFKRNDEFTNVELHTVINIDNNFTIDRIKKKSLFRKIFGC